jgi:hypothetical protein
MVLAGGWLIDIGVARIPGRWANKTGNDEHGFGFRDARPLV